MIKGLWILFPNQLFDREHLHELVTAIHGKRVQDVIVVEDPSFFGDRRGGQYGTPSLQLHKGRLAYDLVVCHEYVCWLQKEFRSTARIMHVKLSELWKKGSHLQKLLKGVHAIHMYNPVDHLVLKRWTTLCKRHIGCKLEVHNSPMFLLSHQDILTYTNGHTQLRHAHFYEWMKKKLDRDGWNLQLPNKSMDKDNRKTWKSGQDPTIPKHPSKCAPRCTCATSQSHCHCQCCQKALSPEHRQVVEVAEKLFPKNTGCSHIWLKYSLPLNHKQALLWLDDFLVKRFAYFGPYQDAIVEGETWLFHSGLSILLNRGLITPDIVLRKVRDYYLQHKNHVSLSSYEGFVRQIIGWREFCRLYYVTVSPSQIKLNALSFPRQPLPSYWYKVDVASSSGTTVDIIHQTIRDAWRDGYLHHIRRLMVIANFMTLNEVHPDMVYKWMYEFAFDSYEWAMVFNVYAMGTYSDGGIATYKPYISSAEYLIKMGVNMSKNDVVIWNQMYKQFVWKHRDILLHTPLAGIVRKYSRSPLQQK